MADTKISAMTAGTTIVGTEVVPGVQSSANVKFTINQIKTWTSASPTLVTPVLDVATATSIAIGGATIGSNALAVTGTANISGVVTINTTTLTGGASNLMTLNGGLKTTLATAILGSATTITGGATGNVPTLTAGPVTGNPTKWLPYNDNGTTRYIPAW